jgi:hypothetical protein
MLVLKLMKKLTLKFIEQLSGKIGQSLRKPLKLKDVDFELEKFTINSLLSATHASEMDDNVKTIL